MKDVLLVLYSIQLMAFDIDFKEKGYIKEHIWSFLLFPEHWKDPSNIVPVHLDWKKVEFNNASLAMVPNDQKGIYCFVVKPEISELFDTNYLYYVGKTTRNFNVRFKEYLNDQAGKGKPRPKVFTMLKLWKDYLHFYYASVDNNVTIGACEEIYLNALVPKVNTDIPKAKIKPELKNIY